VDRGNPTSFPQNEVDEKKKDKGHDSTWRLFTPKKPRGELWKKRRELALHGAKKRNNEMEIRGLMQVATRPS